MGRRLMDRSIQIRTRQSGKNALGESLKDFADGRTLKASHTPVSDGERFRAGQIEAASVSRFVVRYSAYSAAITQDDRLMFEGAEWQIKGLKTLGRNRWIEITAWRN
ncbi:phage head closure protein [Ruegeria litorea]|uniref:Phage head closure protein n=1 Tax=Falsiruegeria litorea TaxID=1280831 RepID=A0ABS5WUU7_9RHOB|nr:phage head closure protein [Falsiruegeria litorea]MBT3142912.1 phage head closure protein [Falsiruegeria litorea]